MADMYKLYSQTGKVRFVSISVDPERDTPEALAQYAKQYGVNDEGWMFLRAPLEQVIDLSEKGLMLPAENVPMGHSPKFVLVDSEGKIRGYYNPLEDEAIELLKTHIQALARRME